MKAGRARAEGRTAMGARAAAALEKGRRKRAAFMMGYLEFCGSARCCGGPIGGTEPASGELTHWTRWSKPGEMSGDGVAVAGVLVVLLSSSAKARTAAIPEVAASVRWLGAAFPTNSALPHDYSSVSHIASLKVLETPILSPPPSASPFTIAFADVLERPCCTPPDCLTLEFKVCTVLQT